jgi:HK97 family phage major capsid protein
MTPLEEIQKMMADIQKAIKENGKIDKEAIMKDLRQMVTKGRKTEDLLISGSQAVFDYRSLCDKLPEEAQLAGDGVYITAALLGVNAKSLKQWAPFEEMVTAAMDSETAEEGLEWIPTEFSSSLIEKVRLMLKVAALHTRFNMPTNPFKFPAEGADAVAYKMAQSTSDTASKITASTPGTTNIVFDAIKLAARVLASKEVEEDSIIAIIPYIQGKIATALAEAQENATINGDTAGSHMDADITDAADARKAWDGYRKLAQSGAKVDLSTFEIANIRGVRKAMGKYGINPNDLAWVASVATYYKMLGIAEVVTVDKYGPSATILTGELAKLDGIPIVVSEFVREDLNDAGVQDGQTETDTVLPLVYRPGFMYGDRRNVTMQVLREVYAEADQDAIIATQRLDFQAMHEVTTEFIVGLGYNITV